MQKEDSRSSTIGDVEERCIMPFARQHKFRSTCRAFGWSTLQWHPVRAGKLIARFYVLAALATSLAACSSSEHSRDYYDEQAIDPFVKKVCEPAGNNFYYRRLPGPAVLHAVGVAPDKLADGWTVSTLQEEGFDPEVIDKLLQAVEKGDFPNLDSILIARNGKLTGGLFQRLQPGEQAPNIFRHQEFCFRLGRYRNRQGINHRYQPAGFVIFS